MMARAGFVHSKGVGCVFHARRQACRWSMRARLEGKSVIDSDGLVRMPKHPSMWFSHEALVGV
jgi:hypothetical protein